MKFFVTISDLTHDVSPPTKMILLQILSLLQIVEVTYLKDNKNVSHTKQNLLQ